MNYTHSVVNGFQILDLIGSIDLYSTPLIKKFAKTLLLSAETKVIVSLEKVTFLDSSGLGMLANLFFECKQRSIPIVLANLSPAAKRILTLTKMTNSYQIFDSIEEAIQSISNP
ncbi:MAG TPA: STAS domain-containing protein [Leptospiraceae bacterium]|nr:STAS domain-containing protein [Leptospiraceae bacterium]HMW04382.1 STAS domain-containing protein [Leptospiraceae bacterium]HMX31048.1 STAS domain-containing protein [Leptospiraceae bacterium]HMY31864.1 STAS domain-containing protein [Leptospiraceae bacterium]HMZ63853.1 STAS domain-containing protein [Leptospiraceae bacterium]